MNESLTWDDLVSQVELVDLRICSCLGILAEVYDGEPLPEDWQPEFDIMTKADGSLHRVRARLAFTGPGGKLVSDGMGVFSFGCDTTEVSDELLERFTTMVAVPAIIPFVRASLGDLNDRMQLDAPRLGLMKIEPHGELDDTSSDLL
ncbi:MAG: hypothetical protein FWG16_07965 [Micrococcales bacterium]|nr:hypothetical protein [Micrococcales bacterium]